VEPEQLVPQIETNDSDGSIEPLDGFYIVFGYIGDAHWADLIMASELGSSETVCPEGMIR